MISLEYFQIINICDFHQFDGQICAVCTKKQTISHPMPNEKPSVLGFMRV